jgi:hypothetical protein
MKNKLFFTFLALALFLPCFFFADAPPPPPFTVDFTYEGQKISDQTFYAAVLECVWPDYQEISVVPQLNISQEDSDKDCTWRPVVVPYNNTCTNSECRFDWVLGDFKLAVYVPSLNKTFLSETLARTYEGHYGYKTKTLYNVQLLKDNSIKIEDIIPLDDEGINNVSFILLMSVSFAITLALEALIILIFVLFKKVPKRIFLGLLIGNIISVPFVWFVSYIFPLAGIIYIAEAIVVVFEAWIFRIFSRRALSWKMALLISLLINIVSFFLGPFLIAFDVFM